MAALEVEPVPDCPPEIGYPLASLERTRRYLVGYLDQIEQEALDLTPYGHQYSVATLLYHVAVMEMDWLFTRMLGRDPQENGIPSAPDHIQPYLRYQPFQVADQYTQVRGERLTTHLDRLTATRLELLDTIRPMSVEQFRSASGKGDRTYTPEWVVEHLIQHEAEHRGQVLEARLAAESESE